MRIGKYVFSSLNLLSIRSSADIPLSRLVHHRSYDWTISPFLELLSQTFDSKSRLTKQKCFFCMESSVSSDNLLSWLLFLSYFEVWWWWIMNIFTTKVVSFLVEFMSNLLCKLFVKCTVCYLGHFGIAMRSISMKRKVLNSWRYPILWVSIFQANMTESI